jgi:hypothetical protein
MVVSLSTCSSWGEFFALSAGEEEGLLQQQQQQSILSQASWGKLEMKPTWAGKQRQNKDENWKERGERRAIKNK